MSPKVLIISTSHEQLGDTNEKTGVWAEELIAPYELFKQHGCDVTIASIKGGEIPFDEASLNPPFLTPEVEKFLLDDASMKNVMQSKLFTDFNISDFDAVFLPGGHGVCWDFPDNQDLIAMLSEAYCSGKIVSAVCHGPMGLVNVKDAEGKPIVQGKKVTGFTDAEEYAVAKEKLVPFMLEARLKELGGLFEAAAENWAPHAVADGNLVTGQNPGSSTAVAQLVLKTLGVTA